MKKEQWDLVYKEFKIKRRTANYWFIYFVDCDVQDLKIIRRAPSSGSACWAIVNSNNGYSLWERFRTKERAQKIVKRLEETEVLFI